MAQRDYYEILGVAKTATDKDIRKAYRRLARQHHPDLNPGDKAAEERFKEINEAYETLNNAETRKKYDAYGHNWKQAEQMRQQGGGRAPGAGAGGFGFRPQGGNVRYEQRNVNPEDLEDLLGGDSPFADLFGGMGRGGVRNGGRRAHRGQDMEHEVEISLQEAYRGTVRLIQVADASGALRRVEAKIPPGVDTGSRVRLAGQGGPGGGGPGGDLYLTIKVLPDAVYQREGADLRMQVAAPLTTAMLGGEAEISTPDGRKVALRIPPETQNGNIFRLRGKGMPRLGRASEYGDLLAEVKVVLPQQLSEREKELFKELSRLRAGEVAASR